jgi:hypothetical protein
MLGALALASVGCTSTSAPPSSVGAAGQRLNAHDEAARLIGALAISERMRNAARDYVIEQMARGVGPRPALREWVAMQRRQGVTIRCAPSATADCVVGS